MGDTNEAKEDMDAQAERPSISKFLGVNTDEICERAFERREVSDRIARLERAIEANPEGVSEHHKNVWRKQAEAMRTYKEVLGELIKDLIDNE